MPAPGQGMAGLAELASHFWQEAGKKCGRACVFLDGPMAECLHWSGGPGLLSGAALLREFSVFESAPPECRKAVFVVSGPVLGPVEDTLRAIVQASTLHYCVVITACHPAVSSWAQQPSKDWSTEDPSSFHRLEELLLHWMGNVNNTAEVLHLPLSLCSPLPCLMLAPGSTALLAPTQPDLDRAALLWREAHPGQTAPEPGSWASLPPALQVRVRQAAASLHSLLTSLSAAEEIWSAGPLARALGEQLEAWAPARARRKAASTKVSLILLDRTLDLASCCPVTTSQDSLLARATDLLPRLPGHATDLCVELGHLLGLAPGPGPIVPSGLASPGLRPEDGAREQEELEAVACRPEKEALGLLHRNLNTNSPRKRKSPDSGGKKFVNLATLAADLKEYEGDYEAVLANLSTVTRAQAAVTCLAPDRNLRRKKVATLCSQMGQSMGRSGAVGLLAEVTELVRGRREHGLRLEELLTVVLFLHSALDTREQFPQEEEERLRAVLGEAILRDGGAEGGLGPVLGELARRSGGDQGLDEVVALGVVDRVWARLEGLRTSRAGLGAFHSLIGAEGGLAGLVGQVLAAVYSPEQGEVAGLHHHAGGLGAMLRTGLGWLSSSVAAAKPHPRESPLVLVVVLGGVTPGEVAAAGRAAKGTESRLVLAGSRLLSTRDALELAFTHDCLA